MITIPILEIAVFIVAGEVLGLWKTIGFVFLTAVVGSALLRHQGLTTLAQVRDSMNSGRMPVAELFEGLCQLIAGALLLTPGFITDGIGLLLFVPSFRLVLRGLMTRQFKIHGNLQSQQQNPLRRSNTTIIEGEYKEVDLKESDANEKQNNSGKT
jgi:UPF0716 protein FxsA